MAEYCPICGNKITGFIKPNINKLQLAQKQVTLSLTVCKTCFEMLALQDEDRREKICGEDLLAAFVTNDDIEKSISYFSEKFTRIKDESLRQELTDIVYRLKRHRNFWGRVVAAKENYVKRTEELWDQFSTKHKISAQAEVVLPYPYGLLKIWIGRDDTHLYMRYPTRDTAEAAYSKRFESRIVTKTSAEEALLEKEDALRRDDIIFEQKILLKDILYFQLKGDKQYITEIHGGGVNTGGALAGGMLFGVAGAIVGGQLGTEIQSETKEIDERSVILKYSDENENTVVVPFDIAFNDAFMAVIPEKEYDQVALPKDKRISEQTTPVLTTSSSISAADEILKFKNLLDMGAITQEEFDTKKKELLGL